MMPWIGVDLLETWIADWVLGFAFFTALAYAVLGRRFGNQRAAIVLSASMGLSLSIGLVFWESQTGITIRHLGPLAAGFGLLMISIVLFQAIRQVGGTWAGIGLAAGFTLLLSWLVQLGLPLDPALLNLLVIGLLVGGVLLFLHHRRGVLESELAARSPQSGKERRPVYHDLRDLERDHTLSQQIGRRLDTLKQQTRTAQPDALRLARQRLRELLPAEGALTRRLAQLREKATLMGSGQAARIRELEAALRRLPKEQRVAAERELANRYRQLQFDQRVQRLDQAVADAEQRIGALTRQAAEAIEVYDFGRLHQSLDAAAKLQRQTTRLLELIIRDEAELLKLAEQARGERPASP